MEDGGLAPDLPEVFAVLGDSPWAVYRFLVQPHPAFGGSAPINALHSGATTRIIDAAKGVARGDFG